MIDPLLPKSSPPRASFKKRLPLGSLDGAVKEGRKKGDQEVGSITAPDDESTVHSLRCSAPAKLLSPLDESFLIGDDDMSEASDWLETNTSFIFHTSFNGDVLDLGKAKRPHVIIKPIVIKKVCFANVEVREYGMILGDNPNARRGLPVTLDWHHQREDSMSMDMYKYMRSIGYYGKSSSNSSHGNRGARGTRRLSSTYRRDYLQKLGVYSAYDFIKVIEECTEIQQSRMRNAEIKDAALFRRLVHGGEQASGFVFSFSGNMAGLALGMANTAYSGTKAVAILGVNGTKIMANTAINGTKAVATKTKVVANTAINGTKAVALAGVNGTKVMANTALNGTKAVATFGVNGTKTVANTAYNGTKAVATFGVNGTKTVANTAINGTKAVANFGVNGTKTMANIGASAVGTSSKVLRQGGKSLAKAIALPVGGSRPPKRRTSMGPGTIGATATF